MGIYLFPDAQSFPAVEVVGDGCIGREVFGQVSPRAACGEDVEDGVEDVAWVVFGLGSVDALGQEWLDELPLLVGETELVGVVCCVHREFFSTFLLPVYALRFVAQRLQRGAPTASIALLSPAAHHSQATRSSSRESCPTGTATR